MSMRLFGLALSAALVLGGCGGGGGGQGGSENITGSNSGVAVPFFNGAAASAGGIVFFLASEKDQAFIDLNGDGDPADNVVHSIDPTTGIVTNLGLSAASIPVAIGNYVVWLVAETGEGIFDFSGDGDFGDYVLAVFDTTLPISPTNPTITSTVVSFNNPILAEGNTAVFVTSEADAGLDLNADGDSSDFVVRTRDLVTGTVTNAALAWDAASSRLSVGNGLVVFSASETLTGPMGTDLNGDGDMTDVVLFSLDIATGVTSGVGGTPRATSGSAVIGGTPATPYICYAIDESNEADTNLNGGFADNDTMDFVIAVWDVNAGVETLPLGGLAVDPFQLSANATRMAFVAKEADNGSSLDLNGDGDTLDEMPYWADIASPALATNVGLASTPGVAQLSVCDLYLVFNASESSQGASGTNYNTWTGDTDSSDDVAHWLDISVPGLPLRSLRYATTALLCIDGENTIFITSDEGDNGPNLDINGDGDQSDIVPIYFRVDAANGAVVQGISPIITDGPLAFQVCPTQVRIFGNASEANLNNDFNEDGDFDDYAIVASLIRRNDGEIQKFTFIHGSDRDGSSFPILIDANTIIFPFSEEMVGTGLNYNGAAGDTDASDTIFMFANTPCQ